MDGMQAPPLDSMFDRTPAESEAPELLTRDHAVLILRELRNRPIATIRTLTPTIGGNVRFVEHAASLIPLPAPERPRLWRNRPEGKSIECRTLTRTND
jgi:hypothetical protein